MGVVIPIKWMLSVPDQERHMTRTIAAALSALVLLSACGKEDPPTATEALPILGEAQTGDDALILDGEFSELNDIVEESAHLVADHPIARSWVFETADGTICLSTQPMVDDQPRQTIGGSCIEPAGYLEEGLYIQQQDADSAVISLLFPAGIDGDSLAQEMAKIDGVFLDAVGDTFIINAPVSAREDLRAAKVKTTNGDTFVNPIIGSPK